MNTLRLVNIGVNMFNAHSTYTQFLIQFKQIFIGFQNIQ